MHRVVKPSSAGVILILVNVVGPVSASVRIRLLREAVARRPTASALLFNLSDALIEAGEYDDAAECYRRAVVQAPGAQFPSPELARILVERGVLLPQILAGLAIGAAQEGHVDEVRRLVDYDRFIRRLTFPVPNGFGHDQFYEGLAAASRSDLTFYRGDAKEPATNTWQNDSVTGSHFPAWLAYKETLAAVIRRYIDDLPADRHPFVEARPDDYRLDGWAVVTGQDGHIGSHFHPRAWITTVLYVIRPDASRIPGSTAGWLEIGPPDACANAPGWDTWRLEPEVGTLVIMPGYYFHRTLPFAADQERISLVVDVMDQQFAGRGRGSVDAA